MNACLFVLLGILSMSMNQGTEFTLQGPSARAPVVHLGRYHVLTSGRTSVVLDGARGMSVAMIGEREDAANAAGGLSARLGPGSLQVELNDSGKRLVLDQANDPAARLEIISQGPTHASARAFFTLCSADGRPYGTGTLDIIVYANRVHLIPSLFVDDLNLTAKIVRSGLTLGLPETTGTLEVLGKAVPARPDGRSVTRGLCYARPVRERRRTAAKPVGFRHSRATVRAFGPQSGRRPRGDVRTFAREG